MSTWQIIPDAGNDFRWDISSQEYHTKPCDDDIRRSSNPPRLPSMADLLLEGYSKIMETREEKVDDVPMFRTGFGKSVTLKQSSIARALSVLGDENIGGGFGQLPNQAQKPGVSNSLFQTASGKSVNISSSGMARAKSLLGCYENNNDSTFQICDTLRAGLSTPENNRCESVHNLENKRATVNGSGSVSQNHTPIANRPLHATTSLIEHSSSDENDGNCVRSEMHYVASKPPPIKFLTAGGRSISVSGDALKRAKSLLGDPELGDFLNGGMTNDSSSSFSRDRSCGSTYLSKENIQIATPSIDEHERRKHSLNCFISPLHTSSNIKQSVARLEGEKEKFGCNLIQKFNAEESIYDPNGKMPYLPKRLQDKSSMPSTGTHDAMVDSTASKFKRLKTLSVGPLADITNNIAEDHAHKKGDTAELKKFRRRSSPSPFKRPRNSKFVTPLNRKISLPPSGLSNREIEKSPCIKSISTRYPGKSSRMSVKDFFVRPTYNQTMLNHLPAQEKMMNPRDAELYMFCEEAGSSLFGAEAFYYMLGDSGASENYASKEWVANHYKWIVWKLACYDRYGPAKRPRKFLTVSNVLDELKYRYEREVNHGHRSAIKRVLEGDAQPSTMMILCISKINLEHKSVNETQPEFAQVELTDGWYSLDAQLDTLLTKYLAAKKLFVGQKLRICGAGLCGWDGPVSPLESSRTVKLLLHVNGTYKASWHDCLGFCRGACTPLAFKCIKANGGPIPRTLVGIMRIYPVLYRERLSDGGYIVRSQKMESNMMQVYSHKRSLIIDDVMSEFQRGNGSSPTAEDDEEGAKILKMLETAAEPEVLMAEMSSDQLATFTTYKAKVEAFRQSDLQSSVDKALKAAGLSSREVIPFIRVRVVGLNNLNWPVNKGPNEGLVTIWDPTEKQKLELVEGQAYEVMGLKSSHSDSKTLYLQTKGSAARWRPLTCIEKESFAPFFKPRKSIVLSQLGEVPLSSEFDITVLVIYVGREYTAGCQKRQWVFATDSSVSELLTEESANSLLAISFCSPHDEDDQISPINQNLVGSIVGFCNLIKRTKDQRNDLWVAEATENSIYYLNFGDPLCSHLKHAAASVQRWTVTASSSIQKLREKVQLIIGETQG